ncbi:MAG: hypothetical protein ABSD20_20585, partial [Terriglobales bacterium]
MRTALRITCAHRPECPGWTLSFDAQMSNRSGVLQPKQSSDLHWSKPAVFAGWNVKLQRPVTHALDFLHPVSDVFEHAPDLAIAPLGKRDLKPRILGFTAH